MRTYAIENSLCTTRGIGTMETTVIILLGASLFATGIMQFLQPFFPRLASELTAIAPVWKLFGPRPYDSDWALIVAYEGKRPELGQGLDWTEVVVPRHAGWRTAMWNPSQYAEQGIYRLISSIMLPRRGVDRLCNSPAYDALCGLAQSVVPPPLGSTHYRIAVVQIHAHASPALVLVSQPRALTAPCVVLGSGCQKGFVKD